MQWVQLEQYRCPRWALWSQYDHCYPQQRILALVQPTSLQLRKKMRRHAGPGWPDQSYTQLGSFGSSKLDCRNYPCLLWSYPYFCEECGWKWHSMSQLYDRNDCMSCTMVPRCQGQGLQFDEDYQNTNQWSDHIVEEYRTIRLEGRILCQILLFLGLSVYLFPWKVGSMSCMVALKYWQEGSSLSMWNPIAGPSIGLLNALFLSKTPFPLCL